MKIWGIKLRELIDVRADIDAIDAQLLPLFEARMQLSREVAEIKRTQNLPVYVPERERELLDQICENVTDRTLMRPVSDFFSALMRISREEQLRVFDCDE